jgi:hypothetical protein
MSEHIERCRSLVVRLEETAQSLRKSQSGWCASVANENFAAAAALRALLDERDRLERERDTLVSMMMADCVRFTSPGPPGRGVYYEYNRQRYDNANDVRAAMLADAAEEY